MQKGLIFLFRHIGLRAVYSIMGCIIPFYMLFAHKGYIAMYHFFRRRFGYGILKSFGSVYMNHFTFGQVILDRFAVYAGKQFQIGIEGYENFTRLVSGNDGFVQLSSHIGNYELAGYSLHDERKKFNALIYSGETETVMANRTNTLSKNNIRMIPLQNDMSHIFIINNALMNGEIVSIPGDRIFGSAKHVDCDFLGGKAKFPLGPFAIAVEREVELLSVFVMKESVRKYTIYVKPVKLQDGFTGSTKREKMDALAQSFATNLEGIVRQYPLQWFNYFEFWD